jgi:hypothetical protein
LQTPITDLERDGMLASPQTAQQIISTHTAGTDAPASKPTEIPNLLSEFRDYRRTYGSRSVSVTGGLGARHDVVEPYSDSGFEKADGFGEASYIGPKARVWAWPEVAPKPYIQTPLTLA